MNRWRWVIVLLGPVPIVLGSLGLSQWMKSDRLYVTTNQAIVRGQQPSADFEAVTAQQESPRAASRTPAGARLPADQSLEESCDVVARQLTGHLGPDCQTIARSPFVIAGDCDVATLDRWHQQTIGPAARAMASSYFRSPPDRPITVLLFNGEQSYNRYARQLYGDEEISVYGYYKPGQRTLVMNISTGGGTLVHELTHALMAFDFPQVPDWFNEGLASLHEQCHIRSDESGIDGLVNWRLDGLQRALADGKLRPLALLVRSNDFRGGQQTLNYAQSRYFCQFMQERGVLTDYFRCFRDDVQADPLGYRTVSAVFPDHTWEELDVEFRSWVAGLRR